MTQKKDISAKDGNVKEHIKTEAELIREYTGRSHEKLPPDFRGILLEEIKLLRLPVATPKYPFKPFRPLADESEYFQTGVGLGDYLFREVDYAIIRFLFGTYDLNKVSKSRLKGFLANKCNVPYSNLEKFSWPEIREFSLSGFETEYAIKRSTTDHSQEIAPKPLLSERQLEIWNSLAGKCLSAKELSKSLDLHDENIRKHIQAIRKKFGQEAIKNTRSRGYWRSDAPPSDMRDNI